MDEHVDEPAENPALSDRARLTRRIAVSVAALVVVGGAVLVLRTPEPAGNADPAPPPPPQTTVRQFTKDGVIAPGPGDKPKPPARFDVRPGPNRLLVGWPEPSGAAGYEVSWGTGGRTDRSRLVAQPLIQLDALDEAEYTVSVKTVDSYGQRSAAATATATPTSGADPTGFSFADRFVGRVVPEPARWRLASVDGCGRATRGDGEDGRRLVISAQCGAEPVVLRSRAPFRTHESPVNGELGRLTVDTDHPGQLGELTLDLVPGPVDMIDGSPNGPPKPGPPGLAQNDPSLPPGTVRVRIATRSDERRVETTVQVLVAGGTPRLGRALPVTPPPPPMIGISTRWSVVLRTDGVFVERDGVVVAAGDVAPTWREATALVGFSGTSSGLRAAVDLIGFTGAPTAPPALVVAPKIVVPGTVDEAGALRTSPSGQRIPGILGGQLRLTLIPQRGSTDPTTDQFTVELAGREFPAVPAIPNQPMQRGVRYPVVVDLPVEALLVSTKDELALRVRGVTRRAEAPARVATADLELIAVPDAPSAISGSGTEVPMPTSGPALPRPGADLLDAAGKPIESSGLVPRGRLVLDVFTDGPAGQRVTGELAGVAGVEVRVDGDRVVGIPTIADGPGAGGRWRVALNTADLAPGRHTVEIKVIGVDPKAPFAVAYEPFLLAE